MQEPNHDLLKGVIADPSVITVNGKEVSVKYWDQQAGTSEDEYRWQWLLRTILRDDWETLGQYARTITPETPQQQYVVTYRAYYADENGAETDCGSKEVLLSVAATGGSMGQYFQMIRIKDRSIYFQCRDPEG